MVDGDDLAPVATFYAPAFGVHDRVVLDQDAAHHAHVRRLETGTIVRLTNGAGRIGIGEIATMTRATMDIVIREVKTRAPLTEIHMLVPVADRTRMLWLAEKCAELAVTTWQPVRFRRSMSVSPRGEGDPFRQKVRARMIAAIEQSAGAWLPEMQPETELRWAIETKATTRLLLDPDGAPIRSVLLPGSVAALIGPEGGLESDERSMLTNAGWQPVRLEGNLLRFETAGVAAAAVLRALTAA